MPRSLRCNDGCGWFCVGPASVGIGANGLCNQKSITNRFPLKMNSKYASRHTVSFTSSDMFGNRWIAGGLSGRVGLLSIGHRAEALRSARLAFQPKDWNNCPSLPNAPIHDLRLDKINSIIDTRTPSATFPAHFGQLFQYGASLVRSTTSQIRLWPTQRNRNTFIHSERTRPTATAR
jgi:hypothetical protein